MQWITTFNTENFFQHFFTKYENTANAILRMLDLDGTWKMGGKDEINAILNSHIRQPTIEVDSGLINHNSIILPIELETFPGVYTLIQVPHYCYRARHYAYRQKSGIDLSVIRTIMVSIGLDSDYAKKLQGATCVPMAIFPSDERRKLMILENDNPVLSALQQLLTDWDSETYQEILSREDYTSLGKVFISCWILLLGEESRMAEIRAEVKKAIEEQFGSEEEFVKEAIEEEGAVVLKLFSAEQLKALTPKQLREFGPMMSPEQATALLKTLSPEQIKTLSIDQLEELPLDVLKEVIKRKEMKSK